MGGIAKFAKAVTKTLAFAGKDTIHAIAGGGAAPANQVTRVARLDFPLSDDPYLQVEGRSSLSSMGFGPPTVDLPTRATDTNQTYCSADARANQAECAPGNPVVHVSAAFVCLYRGADMC